MNKEKIITEIANKFNIDIETISGDSRFNEDLHLDSIDLVETLMDIEEENNIQISDEKALTIKTVDDFVNIVLEEING
ncbi:MAG: acyl carrier protein [Mycoplasmatales bacterium]